MCETVSRGYPARINEPGHFKVSKKTIPSVAEEEIGRLNVVVDESVAVSPLNPVARMLYPPDRLSHRDTLKAPVDLVLDGSMFRYVGNQESRSRV